MRTLTEAKVLLETLEAITSDFLLAKFVEVAEVEGFEFRVPLYSKYYMFKQAEEGVPFNPPPQEVSIFYKVEMNCGIIILDADAS